MVKQDLVINPAVVSFSLITIDYLPLRYAPLELEFTIVNDRGLPLATPQGTGAGTQTDKKGYYFTAGNTSTSWELNNGILRAEMITLDDTVNNNIVKHLLDGHSITQMPEVVKLI